MTVTALVYILILASLAASLATSVLSYTLFWLEVRRSPYRAHLARLSRSLPGGIFQLLVQAWLSSLLSQLMCLWSYPLGLASWVFPAQARSLPGTPIVGLVHGLSATSSTWSMLRKRLIRAGLTDVRMKTFNTFTLGFDELAGQVDEWLLSMIRAEPGRPLILIGHSLGGLLVREAALHSEIAAATAGLVTLGSPHQGSKLARLSPTRPAQDILYRSPRLARLIKDEREAPMPRAPRLNIYSPVDNLVLPPESLRIDLDGWIEAQTSAVSHVALLFDRHTSRLIIRFLRRTLASRAASGQG